MGRPSPKALALLGALAAALPSPAQRGGAPPDDGPELPPPVFCHGSWWARAPARSAAFLVGRTLRDAPQAPATELRCGDDGDSLLHLAAAHSPRPEAVAALLDAGFDPEERNDLGEDALDLAALNGNPAVLRLLEERLGEPPGDDPPPVPAGLGPRPHADPEGPSPGRGGAEWYVGIGGGSFHPLEAAVSTADHDSACYPGETCFTDALRLRPFFPTEDGLLRYLARGASRTKGRQWSHRLLRRGESLALAAFAGVRQGRLRFELAGGLSRSGVRLARTGAWTELQKPLWADLDDRDDPPELVPGDASRSVFRAEDLSVRWASVDAYLDFARFEEGALVPYLGFGMGAAHASVRGLSRENDPVPSPLPGAPPASFHAILRRGDAASVLPLFRLHAGLDMVLGDGRRALGLKATLDRMGGGLRRTAGFERHPGLAVDPDAADRVAIDGLGGVTASMTLKWLRPRGRRARPEASP